jgi:hypothetical protein
MARQAGNDNLSSLSSRRVFELFARLAEQLVTEQDRPFLFDALFFDYCSTEMPLMGKLPYFADTHQPECRWPGRKQLPERLDIPADSRVKAFRCTFNHDYRNEPWEIGPQQFTFMYISGAGQGLRVVVVPE